MGRSASAEDRFLHREELCALGWDQVLPHAVAILRAFATALLFDVTGGEGPVARMRATIRMLVRLLYRAAVDYIIPAACCIPMMLRRGLSRPQPTIL